METPLSDTEEYRNKIATVDDQGKRAWIYPKKPNGKFYDWRKYVSYVLLLFLFGTPFVKWNGDPILLFNVLERRFIIFGLHFTPQDFYLFVFGMLIFIVFIILFTVVFGRLFCGWVCPQTIFMEMVFRRIEYWIEGDANAQKRLNKAAWTPEKLFKKVSKQVLFFGVAVLIANTFLAYIIGMDQVIQIITEPIQEHWEGFISMVVFAFAFYFVFSYMREQVCVTICPYGRLQGVLLDKNSIAVYYDFERGEPRGKMKKKRPAKSSENNTPITTPIANSSCANCGTGADCKKETTEQAPVATSVLNLGDCIDCNLCVKVCPTGIDIRDGIQMECVNCTACMDACDEVMEKIDRPLGLIRYDSHEGIVAQRKQIFTPRVKAYSAVLFLLLSVQIYLLATRSSVDTLLLRTSGMLFQETEEGNIRNLYNYQIMNKTKTPLNIEFRLLDHTGTITVVGNSPVAGPEQLTSGSLFIEIPPEALRGRKNDLTVGVYVEEELIESLGTNFLGPVK
ncbi:MAG: 4Fe-4S dicluster domain-containing protein [Saprospiraceae bacterium]